MMRTAHFKDGTACGLGSLNGDYFHPREGEVFLFEFPDGRLEEGFVVDEDRPASSGRFEIFDGVFDEFSRLVSLEQ
jgi:hypothetical protein